MRSPRTPGDFDPRLEPNLVDRVRRLGPSPRAGAHETRSRNPLFHFDDFPNHRRRHAVFEFQNGLRRRGILVVARKMKQKICRVLQTKFFEEQSPFRTHSFDEFRGGAKLEFQSGRCHGSQYGGCGYTLIMGTVWHSVSSHNVHKIGHFSLNASSRVHQNAGIKSPNFQGAL